MTRVNRSAFYPLSLPLFRKPTSSEHLEKGRGELRELFKEKFFKAPKKATGPHIFQTVPMLFLLYKKIQRHNKAVFTTEMTLTSTYSGTIRI